MPITASDAAFRGKSGEFLEYYDTMRGHVREKLTRAYLLEQLVENNSIGGTVIDVGGGDGRDLRWLSDSLGNYEMTLVDPDQEMIEKAESVNPGYAILKCSAVDLARKRSHHEKYDLVLSHGVFQYELEKPTKHLETLVRLAKPGGLISLLTKGQIGGLHRLKRRGASPNEIEQLHLTGRSINGVGADTMAYPYELLEEKLRRAGAPVIAFAGVRIRSDEDYRLWREVDYHERKKILENEFRDGKDPRMRNNGRMLHIIAQRQKT